MGEASPYPLGDFFNVMQSRCQVQQAQLAANILVAKLQKGEETQLREWILEHMQSASQVGHAVCAGTSVGGFL